MQEWAKALPPGAPFPSEAEIAEVAGVSRATVRLALSTLVQAGILYTKPGSGTFVAKPRLETDLNAPRGFTETSRGMGREPSTKVFRIDRLGASPEVAHALELNEGQVVWVIERVRRLDGVAAMVEIAHLPVQIFPRLDRERLDGSLYDLMRSHYHQAPDHGTESVFAVNADAHLAVQLGVPLAAALLASIRVSRSRVGLPLEYTQRFVRPDLCAYSVRLGQDSHLEVRPDRDLLSPLQTSITIKSRP